MLIYLCNELNTTDPNGPCYTVSDILTNLLFIISLSLSLSLSLILIDAIDNSGMTFYHMDTSCQYEAGII